MKIEFHPSTPSRQLPIRSSSGIKHIGFQPNRKPDCAMAHPFSLAVHRCNRHLFIWQDPQQMNRVASRSLPTIPRTLVAPRMAGWRL